MRIFKQSGKERKWLIFEDTIDSKAIGKVLFYRLEIMCFIYRSNQPIYYNTDTNLLKEEVFNQINEKINKINGEKHILIDSMPLSKIYENSYCKSCKAEIHKDEKLCYDCKEEKERIKRNMKPFLNDLNKLYEKYDLSISHEDGHGAFLIERNTIVNWKRICYASIGNLERGRK